MNRRAMNWKRMWVRIPDDCPGCEEGLCDRCAPDGQPQKGDKVAWSPEKLEMLRKLSLAHAALEGVLVDQLEGVDQKHLVEILKNNLSKGGER